MCVLSLNETIWSSCYTGWQGFCPSSFYIQRFHRWSNYSTHRRRWHSIWIGWKQNAFFGEWSDWCQSKSRHQTALSNVHTWMLETTKECVRSNVRSPCLPTANAKINKYTDMSGPSSFFFLVEMCLSRAINAEEKGKRRNSSDEIASIFTQLISQYTHTRMRNRLDVRRAASTNELGTFLFRFFSLT